MDLIFTHETNTKLLVSMHIVIFYLFRVTAIEDGHTKWKSARAELLFLSWFMILIIRIRRQFF